MCARVSPRRTTDLPLPIWAVYIPPPWHHHIDRYVPAETNGGKGFAAFIIALALAMIAAVTYIHKQTYRHPTDATWHGKGSGDRTA